jgi:hypothetical protein
MKLVFHTAKRKNKFFTIYIYIYIENQVVVDFYFYKLCKFLFVFFSKRAILLNWK